MKVLFVASGNKIVGTVSAFISSQYESLQQEGVEMSLFAVKGHGIKGYLKNVALLRSLIKQDKPDVVHAHYSVCGYLSSIASLGLKTKVVVSILGSFPQKKFKLYLVRFCIDHVWNTTIVKSERTRNQLRRTLPVVPNGVNLSQFELINNDEARRQLGLEPGLKYIIFVSNPSRPEKNYSLAELAVKALNDSTVKLIPVFDKPHCEVVKYMCAGDVLLMTSNNEGSPNVIKEAMACNCPIVSTDVGDVKWVTDGVEGTYVAATYEPTEIAQLLRKAVSLPTRTKGREKIIKLGLTTEETAKRLCKIYSSAVSQEMAY